MIWRIALVIGCVMAALVVTLRWAFDGSWLKAVGVVSLSALLTALLMAAAWWAVNP